MKIQSLGSIGADVTGVDLKAVDDSTFEALYRAWLDHAILRFRGQELDDDAMQRFSERFGPLEYAPMGRIKPEELARVRNPYITTISNIIEDGKPIGGLGSAEANWHTDMSYIEDPPTASLLYAVEVPPEGGDTLFCDMAGAFDILPAALRERARGMTLKHDAAHDSVGGLRRGFDHAESPVQAPGCIHPMVMKHPETQREALYLGRRQDAYVPTLNLEQSEALLDEIWSYVALDQHVWTQVWQVGDAVIWDNRTVMHRRAAFAADSRRLMRRTQVRPRPIAAA